MRNPEDHHMLPRAVAGGKRWSEYLDVLEEISAALDVDLGFGREPWTWRGDSPEGPAFDVPALKAGAIFDLAMRALAEQDRLVESDGRQETTLREVSARLGVALAKLFAVPADRIRPDAKLADLLPQGKVPKHWESLRYESGLVLPRLEEPPNSRKIRKPLGTVCWASGAAGIGLFILGYTLCLWRQGHPVALYLALLLLGIAGLSLLASLGVLRVTSPVPPPWCRTFHDLACEAAYLNRHWFPGRLTAPEAWSVICHAIAKGTGLEPRRIERDFDLAGWYAGSSRPAAPPV